MANENIPYRRRYMAYNDPIPGLPQIASGSITYTLLTAGIGEQAALAYVHGSGGVLLRNATFARDFVEMSNRGDAQINGSPLAAWRRWAAGENPASAEHHINNYFNLLTRRGLQEQREADELRQAELNAELILNPPIPRFVAPQQDRESALLQPDHGVANQLAPPRVMLESDIGAGRVGSFAGGIPPSNAMLEADIDRLQRGQNMSAIGLTRALPGSQGSGPALKAPDVFPLGRGIGGEPPATARPASSPASPPHPLRIFLPDDVPAGAFPSPGFGFGSMRQGNVTLPNGSTVRAREVRRRKLAQSKLYSSVAMQVMNTQPTTFYVMWLDYKIASFSTRSSARTFCRAGNKFLRVMGSNSIIHQDSFAQCLTTWFGQVSAGIGYDPPLNVDAN
jgi:hypothetical protein